MSLSGGEYACTLTAGVSGGHFRQLPRHDRERAGGSAVIVQPGALGGKPADQPDVDGLVAVDPPMPTALGVESDRRILACACRVESLDRLR